MRVYYNDSDAFVCAWLCNLITAGLLPAGDVDERPIEQVQPSDVAGYEQCHFFAGIGGWSYALQLAGWGDRPVWTGSCPCQPFSAAGRKRSHGDERHLWPEWFRLIRERRPTVVFGEQVERAINLGWLDAVYADLASEDYAVGALVLGAHSTAAPHVRPRLYFVADADTERRSDLEGWTRSPQSNGRGIADSHGTAVLQHATSERRGTGRRLEQPEASPARRGMDFWKTQPAIPLVVDGVSRSVDGVRSRINAGYGNAVVPYQAAAFVSAYMEVAGLACAVSAGPPETETSSSASRKEPKSEI